jgi:hypothetical protein
MAQIDAKDLDYSEIMVEFFKEVMRKLVTDFDIREDLAKSLIDTYFSLDVSPLERVIVMHRGVIRVAQDLAARD